MRYVVIGVSAAGVTAANLLRRLDSRGEIIILSRDSLSYSRCMLHLRVSGERDDAGLAFADERFFLDRHINWLKGANVLEIRPQENAVVLEGGERVSYGRLLIASGSSATLPPIPNLRGASNVTTLRNMEDAVRLSAWARPRSRCVVIGGGLVGMDAAAALLERKVEITMVEAMDRILALQLDAYAADKYVALLKKNGVGVIVGANIREAVPNGSGGVKALRLADGRGLPCDFCVVAAGVAPNIGFIKNESLALTPNKRAIAVDRRCRTSSENVYAAGDVTFLAPIWPEAVRQASVAARNMAGGDAVLPPLDWAWSNSMNFFGLPTVSYGKCSPPDSSHQEIVYVGGDVYRKAVVKDGRIRGAIFQGDVDNCGAFYRLVREGVGIGGVGKSPLQLNYADFFSQAANGEFVWGSQ